VLHLRGPRRLRHREPDRDVQAQRGGDLLSPHPAEGAAVHATDHLADQVAVREGVLGVGRPGHPFRRSGREHADQVAPVGPCRRRAGLGEGGPAGLVRQQHPQSRGALPWAANSGHTSATGSSRAIPPWSTTQSSDSAAGTFVTEYVVTTVSRCHGVVRAESAQPPHRSTTTSPPTMAQTAAPVSEQGREAVADDGEPGIAVAVRRRCAARTAQRLEPAVGEDRERLAGAGDQAEVQVHGEHLLVRPRFGQDLAPRVDHH